MAGDWITLPPYSKEIGGRTHGVAVSNGGNIFIFHQTNPAMLVYSLDGELLESWGNYQGVHGLALVEEEGKEFFLAHGPEAVRCSQS